MATINLGRVGFVQKGSYSGATAYKVNDVVVYNNGVYACISPTTGNLPTNTTYWKLWLEPSMLVAKTGDETIAGVKTFSSSPIVPTPTTGTQAVNKDYADLKVALSQFTGSNQSLATTGYQKLPSGLIIQWGLSPASTNGSTNAYPISFPNATFAAVATPFADGNVVYNQVVRARITDNNQIILYTLSSDISAFWLAIGY